MELRGATAVEVSEKDELIAEWRRLRERSLVLINEHKSFSQYNHVRCQMDRIERVLAEDYSTDVDDIDV